MYKSSNHIHVLSNVKEEQQNVVSSDKRNTCVLHHLLWD